MRRKGQAGEHRDTVRVTLALTVIHVFIQSSCLFFVFFPTYSDVIV